jgi:hypothetical protein
MEFNRLLGVEVVLLPDIYVQIRFPRSKRARIRRKWKKNPANWVWKSPTGGRILLFEHRFYMDISTYYKEWYRIHGESV